MTSFVAVFSETLEFSWIVTGILSIGTVSYTIKILIYLKVTKLIYSEKNKQKSQWQADCDDNPYND